MEAMIDKSFCLDIFVDTDLHPKGNLGVMKNWQALDALVVQVA